jgi:hypothetical protein
MPPAALSITLTLSTGRKLCWTPSKIFLICGLIPETKLQDSRGDERRQRLRSGRRYRRARRFRVVTPQRGVHLILQVRSQVLRQ